MCTRYRTGTTIIARLVAAANCVHRPAVFQNQYYAQCLPSSDYERWAFTRPVVEVCSKVLGGARPALMYACATPYFLDGAVHLNCARQSSHSLR